jgi:cytochrome c-type biogenesis protein CcmH/NrfF
MTLALKAYRAVLLSAPTFSGFNLTAWVMPFAVLVVGLVVISLLLNHWQKPPLNAPVTGQVLDVDQASVEDELKKFSVED